MLAPARAMRSVRVLEEAGSPRISMAAGIALSTTKLNAMLIWPAGLGDDVKIGQHRLFIDRKGVKKGSVLTIDNGRRLGNAWRRCLFKLYAQTVAS